MPLFEVSPDGLIPFRQLSSGAGVYDDALEEVLWRHLDDLSGEQLFRVRRQAPLNGGGRPAVVALDRQGSVVVVHVRRQIDRAELAECLEYAGWARATSLDELGALYWRGKSEFWPDWQDFGGGAAPAQVKRVPRLFLVTGDFTERAGSTFELLVEHGLPVKVIKASMYEDAQGRRVLDVDGPNDIESVLVPGLAAEATFERLSRVGRRSAERALERGSELFGPLPGTDLPATAVPDWTAERRPDRPERVARREEAERRSEPAARAQHWPEPLELGPTGSLEVRPTSPAAEPQEIAPAEPQPEQPGRTEPSFGRAELSLGNTEPSFGRTEPSLGRAEPSPDRAEPSFGRTDGRLEDRRARRIASRAEERPGVAAQDRGPESPDSTSGEWLERALDSAPEEPSPGLDRRAERTQERPRLPAGDRSAESATLGGSGLTERAERAADDAPMRFAGAEPARRDLASDDQARPGRPPEDEVANTRDRRPDWDTGPSLRQVRDPLSDPFDGSLLPPPVAPPAPPSPSLPLTAEQLRTDPLGVDQIVAGQLSAIEPGTPEPVTNAFGGGPRGPMPHEAPTSGHHPPIPGPAGRDALDAGARDGFPGGGFPNGAHRNEAFQNGEDAPSSLGLPPAPEALGGDQPNGSGRPDAAGPLNGAARPNGAAANDAGQPEVPRRPSGFGRRNGGLPAGGGLPTGAMPPPGPGLLPDGPGFQNGTAPVSGSGLADGADVPNGFAPHGAGFPPGQPSALDGPPSGEFPTGPGVPRGVGYPSGPEAQPGGRGDDPVFGVLPGGRATPMGQPDDSYGRQYDRFRRQDGGPDERPRHPLPPGQDGRQGDGFPPVQGSAPVADPGADPLWGPTPVGRGSHPVTPHPLAPPPPSGFAHPGMARPVPPGEHSGPYDELSPWGPDPRHNEPRHNEPRDNDERRDDQRHSDQRHSDQRHSDQRHSDQRHSDQRRDDPQRNEPRSEPEQLDPRSPRRQPPGSGHGLSVVPPVPEHGDHGQDPHPSHGLAGSNADANESDADRRRLSELMDPRMLRVPETLAWDPRRANGLNGEKGT